MAAYILNAALRSQSLADICAERLDVTLPGAGQLDAMTQAAVEASAAGAAQDALIGILEADPALRRILDELELPLEPVLADMEATGVVLDREALSALAGTFREAIDRLAEDIYASVGHEFNLGSPKQLEQVLFYELDLPRGKRTKTGYSTDAQVLEELRAAHPMIPMLLDWRIYTKLRSTYVEALPHPHRPDHRAPAHHVPAGRRRHGAALLGRPQPAEHPHPHGTGAAHPQRLRGRRR